MAVNWGGVAGIIVFYLLILGVGLWAARKSKGSTDPEETMLAGRNIGIFVGIFTMTGRFERFLFKASLQKTIRA